MAKRIKIKGVRKTELDSDTLAFIYWQIAKRAVEEKRERDAQERLNRAPTTETVR